MTNSRFFAIYGVALTLSIILLPALAAYYLPARVCEDQPYKGGYIEVCHTEPSIHDKRNQ